MRYKDEIIEDLQRHPSRLDGQNLELAAVAIVETEVQLDIRDNLTALITILGSVEKIGYRVG